MTRVFADTYFFLAALNTRDAGHERALEFFGRDEVEFFTTAWVLTEVAAALSPRNHRASFVRLLRDLQSDPAMTILPAEHRLFERGVALYGTRLDKDWSLTDCISFVVMEEQGLRESLTGDHHFAQAGFAVLLG